jgi:hypothetical protein
MQFACAIIGDMGHIPMLLSKARAAPFAANVISSPLVWLEQSPRRLGQ